MSLWKHALVTEVRPKEDLDLTWGASAPWRDTCVHVWYAAPHSFESHEEAGPVADSELQLYSVSWAARCLNHITANWGLCQERQETRPLPSPDSLPHAWHLGHSPSAGLFSALENDISLGQWIPTNEVMKSGEHQARGCVWRLGLWHPPLRAGAHSVYSLFPSFSLAQILLDTSGQSHHTVTSLSCPLGFLNFNVGNYVFPKNNIFIKCPLEPNRSGVVNLQKKRQRSQDLEFKVS